MICPTHVIFVLFSFASFFSFVYSQQDGLVAALDSHPNTTEFANLLRTDPLDITPSGAPFLVFAPNNQAVLSIQNLEAPQKKLRFRIRERAAIPSKNYQTFSSSSNEKPPGKKRQVLETDPSLQNATFSSPGTSPGTVTDANSTSETLWTFAQFFDEVINFRIILDSPSITKRLFARQDPAGGGNPQTVVPQPTQNIFRGRDRQITLTSLLIDPQYANLGPGIGQRVVANRYIDPTNSTNRIIRITSGLGNTQGLTDEAFVFDLGGVRVVDRWFTLPERFSSSLQKLSATLFLSQVRANGLFNDLENKASMTVFVPLDSAFDTGNNVTNNGDGSANVIDNTSDVTSLTRCACEKHIIENWVGYTPQLKSGQSYVSRAGTELRITIKDGDYFVNDVRIVRPNVITKNGVVHLIENQISSPPVSPDAQPNSCAIIEANAASRIRASSGTTLLGIAGIAVGMLVW